MAAKPLALVAPYPRALWMVMTDDTRARLESKLELVIHEHEPMPDALLEAHLPEASFLVGKIPLPAERLARARKLQAVINVEGNWRPDIDYAECERRRIPVLSAAPAMAPAVAEMALGMAIDLARGITPADRAFRSGEERFGILGNLESFLLRGKPMGLIGFGNLGRELLPLLRPFGGRIRVHDPWLPDGLLAEAGVEPAPLDTVLAESKLLFILAGATSENEGFLGAAELDRIREDAAVVFVSRAEVVDFDAFVERARAGRFRAAIDVFPEEPVPKDHPIRDAEEILLSAHRAGGLRESYQRIAEMLADDVELILEGLPPQRLQRAQARTASVARSK
ncbi:MAG: NAD(P)-dependent oxidoreductase [Myxococcota bacterium]|nr:NAD(P)-dependent oxidoreductase [Myxococcota bacterium]